MFQIAAVTGPSAAGIVVAAGGLAWAYFLNAPSFGFVIAALLMMCGVQDQRSPDSKAPQELTLRAALDGLRFVFAQPRSRGR